MLVALIELSVFTMWFVVKYHSGTEQTGLSAVQGLRTAFGSDSPEWSCY